MRTLLLTLRKRLHTFFVLRIRYRHMPSYFYRYSELMDDETLRHAKNLISYPVTSSFKSEVPIQFKSISLNSDLSAFLTDLGSPRYQVVTKYGSVRHAVLIYRSKFCGLSGRIVVHALNNVVLNCSYHLNTESGHKLHEIRSVINSKYGIGECRDDEFVINDAHGNKLLGRFQFDAIISYINGSPEAQQMIQRAYTEANQLKDEMKLRQLEKMQVAF